jgi:hypothetical protein
MDAKLDIIIFALPSWEGDYIKSTVELTKEFVKNDKVNNILYVDYQYTLKDVVTKFKEISILKIFGLKKRISKYNNINVYTPIPLLPINWIKNKTIFSIGAKINSFLLKIGIKKQIKKLQLSNIVVINAFNPVYGYYLNKKLKEIKTIYYCYDEISVCNWINTHGSTYEKKFIKQIDLVICSSTNLVKEKQKYNNNIITIKNGVPFEKYYKYFDANRFNNITTPIIGYSGSIDNRINYDLLKYCIEHIPNATFKLVGRITDNRAYELKHYNNVIFTGALNQIDYAKELNTFHVGIIPFIRNEFTINSNVLKIYDYFAAGLPVITTDFGDLSDFESEINITNDFNNFTNNIKSSILHINAVRATTAKMHSWTNRANIFINEIYNKIY